MNIRAVLDGAGGASFDLTRLTWYVMDIVSVSGKAKRDWGGVSQSS